MSALAGQDAESVDFQQWRRNTRVVILNCFGESHAEEFWTVEFDPRVRVFDDLKDQEIRRERYSKALVEAEALLRSLLYELEINKAPERAGGFREADDTVEQPPMNSERQAGLLAAQQRSLQGAASETTKADTPKERLLKEMVARGLRMAASALERNNGDQIDAEIVWMQEAIERLKALDGR